MDSDGENRASSPEEKNPKRRMKTPFQLEALERVYAEDRYPTEAVRAELSSQLNLSDKQLQMWFCHRRLKDRRGKDEETPGSAGRKKMKTTDKAPVGGGGSAGGGPKAGYSGAVLEPEMANASTMGRNGYAEEFEFEEEEHGVSMMRGSASTQGQHRKVAVQGSEPSARRRNQVMPGRVLDSRNSAESAAISAVEAQLGEPLREDGPALGVEFDPLPPGAFEAPTEHKLEQRVVTAPPRMHSEDRAQERHESRPSKAGAFGLPPLPTTGVKRKAVGLSGQQTVSAQQVPRTPREFQFLPEQPTAREESQSHQRQIQLNLHQNAERSFDLLSASRVRSLSPVGGFLPQNIHSISSSGDGYGFPQERVQNVGISLLPPGESRPSGLYGQNGLGLDEVQRRGLYHSYDVEGQTGFRQSSLQAVAANQSFLGPSENLALFHEHEQARLEKKRKSEEMKVAKESEAHVKRMKRELERQEIVRRKKEEQMRKELEKQDRDKRKEEERAVRERQREEERIQREHKREMERREKLALKENKRIEKQRRKEEVRKAKEAARLKAASERAAAKKLSKESMDTVDDEQLELMEAASAQGLFTINGLEEGCAPVMDLSKVMLKKFPPASIRMKQPLAIPPWTELEHCMGHFLMVWRFLTTFADVIGLWPFTLDEFAQSLHDFDPRLLGEIHIALIKTMVKNIEDAAQAATSGAGGSQHAIALASGGHPQLVESAYEWGFDIRYWSQHASPLTWPEILRQFALATGYGPKWRKRNVEAPPHPREEVEEPLEEENAVNILRSGAAAASAVALMQGKGVGHLRKCRYRLTPGTVKYAAFHVLSLEGSKGLTILEVADRIQKSGLRDLTTSKTPEASIAAALSRDTNLFERVAPSTYCVRPAFRKDPEDAEEVLQAARERIRLFQSGFLDVEEGEKDAEEADEVERDEEYDSEGQDVEDGDADVDTPLQKEVGLKRENVQGGDGAKSQSLAEEEMEIDESQVGEPWVQGLMEGEYSDLSVEERLMALVALVNVVNEGNSIRLALEARMEAAMALKRQMWAEAQIERRRHKEEQLLKLQPALLNAAKNESGEAGDLGTVPSTAAGEKLSESISGSKQELTLELNLVPSDSNMARESSVLGEHTPSRAERDITVHEKIQPHEGLVTPETLASGQVTERSRASVKTDTGVSAEELYVVRSLPLGMDRRRNRYWQFVTCRGGQDPNCGRIFFESSTDGSWEVIDTEEALDALMSSLDIRGTREAVLHAALVRLEPSLRQAMRTASLSSPREHDVKSDIGEGGKPGASGFDGSPSSGLGVEFPLRSGSISVDLGRTDGEKQRALERFKECEQWIWAENSRLLSALRWAKTGRKRETDLLVCCPKCHDLYSAGDKHCQFCHATFPKNQTKYDLHTRDCEDKMKKKDPAWKLCGPSSAVPPRIRILKADMLVIETVIPAEAFRDPWDLHERKAWTSALKRAASPSELLQCFMELESRIHRDWLSSSYETTEELLSARAPSVNTASQVPSWVPQTTAAVALRVTAFDAALSYSSEERKRRQRQEEEERKNLVLTNIGVFPSRTTPEVPVVEKPDLDDDADILPEGGSGRGRGRGRARGRGSRGGGRGGRSSRSAQPAAPSSRVTVKKAVSKRKLQFQEEGANPAGNEGKQGVKGGRGRSKGRPRGRSTGRPRARGSRAGRRTQPVVRKGDKVHKEKNPNELLAEEVARKGQVAEPEEREEEEVGSEEEDGFRSGEAEGSDGHIEDQQEDAEEEEEEDEEDVTGGIQEEDEEDDEGEEEEAQVEEGDDEGQTEDVEDDGQEEESDEEDEERQYDEDSYPQEGEGEDEEAVEPDSDEDEEEEADGSAESARESGED
ncbi:hypothetical protein R1flu_018828 [Riccia fluitans]|uniref:Uncharacterized protein n=1 Tax=Riccia fluitans TaxID=41844 RepID=A0ABD1ZGZ1_9MARC